MSVFDHLQFFLGIDPAPSESQRSDDGALVGAAAWPKNLPEPGQPLSTNEADWWFEYIYARRLTSKEKASARQWSGLIHQLHQAFRFAKIVMDPNGGGTLIKRELILPRQFFNGADRDVTPIADQKDGPTQTITGDFILHLWKRGDPGVEALWPGLPGDENLNDTLYSEMKEALDHGLVLMTPHKKDWLADKETREKLRAWVEERFWSLVNLSILQEQLKNIVVATHEDGTQIFSKRNARQFSALGKKDFVSAAMYCRMAFKMYVTGDEWGGVTAPEDEATISGRRR